MRSPLPKVLHKLGEKTLLQHALAAARGVEPDQLCVVVRHERDQVAAHISQVDPNAIIADQDEIPGTGRATWCALEQMKKVGSLGETTLITSGDVPLLETATLRALADTHVRTGSAVTILSTVVPDAAGYGRIIRGEDDQVTHIVEERDATAEQRKIREINAGIYAFSTDFLVGALEKLDTNNDQGEMYLTDTIGAATVAGLKVSALVLEDSVQAEGVNNPEQLAELSKIYESRKAGERDPQ